MRGELFIAQENLRHVVYAARMRHLRRTAEWTAQTRDCKPNLTGYSPAIHDILYSNNLTDVQRLAQLFELSEFELTFSQKYLVGDITRLIFRGDSYTNVSDNVLSLLLASGCVRSGSYFIVKASRHDSSLLCPLVYLFLDTADATAFFPAYTLASGARAMLPLAQPNLCLWRICSLPHFASYNGQYDARKHYRLSQLSNKLELTPDATSVDEETYMMYAPDEYGICTMDISTFDSICVRMNHRNRTISVPGLSRSCDRILDISNGY